MRESARWPERRLHEPGAAARPKGRAWQPQAAGVFVSARHSRRSAAHVSPAFSPVKAELHCFCGQYKHRRPGERCQQAATQRHEAESVAADGTYGSASVATTTAMVVQSSNGL